MKLIKYWRVQLFKAENRGMAPGNAEVLIFEGYSKDKPKIKLGAGGSFELFTAPDTVETRIFRDNLIDSVRFIPVYEDGQAGHRDPRSSAKASSLMGMDGHVVNHGNLTVPLKAKMPMPGEIFSIVKQVEDEMVGKPLTAETAFSFAEEVKKRVSDLIVIEVA
ncbi:hypothetical protein NL511_25205 [Klebsiella pneumoniae]|uniref:hypothetical protein n=1 Tax=Klebsiella pneumoniae TaxID=573 RepID=UPI0020CE038B|nr:hypothetical protein [Klebsiella pneumoniae]MCP6552963.1 hypothetical protein [Klebsiella pneumoniae]MCP6581446.1 hypothetical protein [Klebsiella pneumoniae]MCP6611602.1 hypothetical protein [Klebsiella pneumoniae]MCQ0500074.1 hypothetical protein [Klebsiella pneumoniae]MDZ1509808.1 hypothetical protein [Klebsiella pneumoniae]